MIILLLVWSHVNVVVSDSMYPIMKRGDFVIVENAGFEFNPNDVNVGDIVRKGQTVAIIEAMKIMNEWEAEFDCRILKVLVDDGQPVEYGTPIFEVEKING